MTKARVRPFPWPRPRLPPPTSVRAIRHLLRHQLRTLISLLKRRGADELLWDATGIPLTPEEDRDWRAEADRALLDLARTADRLQLCLRVRTLLPDPSPAVGEAGALVLLWPCAQALGDLYAKGFPLAPEILAALEAAQRRLGGRPPFRLDADAFLDELRASARDSPRDEVLTLSWLARGLKDPSFLALLLERWQASLEGVSSTTGDRATRTELIEALVAFGREGEARALIAGDDGSVAYLWLAFGAALPDPGAVARARELGERAFQGKPLATFLLRLHRLGQGRGLLERAGQIVAEACADPKMRPGAAGRLIPNVMRGWLIEGDLLEARRMFSLLESGTPVWIEGLVRLYTHTGRAADRDALLEAVAAHDAASLPPFLVSQSLRALLAHGQLDEAVRLVEGWADPLLRCLGFSTFVLGHPVSACGRPGSQSQEAWLDQAEAAYWSVDFRAPRHGHVLAAFVRACLCGWRVDRALAAAGLAASPYLRLRLLALIYFRAEGRPEPPFAADWAERL